MTGESHFRTVNIDLSARPNRTFAEGRSCAEPGCTTRLSRYNRNLRCWQHEPAHEYVPRGPRRSRSRDSGRAA